MIKRFTWIILAVLVLVITIYFAVRNHKAVISALATPTEPSDRFLVTEADGTLESMRISDGQNRSVQMRRDANGTWNITLPILGTADQALASAAETQVSSLRIVTDLNNQLSLVEAGLSPPAYTIELTFAGGLKHILQIGLLTPISSGYYVRYDSANVYVIVQAGIDALLNLLTTPPYPATETPIPTLGATSSPSVATPTP